MATVKPFVKWAGGKSQLLDKISEKYPTQITKYCEPFVGGGAVLLDLLSNHKPKGKVLINDINPQLINTYLQIQSNVAELIDALEKIQKNFWSKNGEERKVLYYEKRARYNTLIKDCNNALERAVLFIFLNKTCFNGLYRVNAKGEYNVPMGAYKMPPICDAENLKAVSSLLQGVEIKCGDYSETEDFIDSDTFVYIDPPYRPLNVTSSFTSYTENEFGDNEQIELGKFIDRLHKKGAKVVASNSDPKNSNANDNFFDDIYCKYSIQRVSAKRMINSKGDSRGNVSELLISNY